MLRTRQLLKEDITYSAAKEREVNILHQLGYVDHQSRFFSYLNARREWMKTVISHHLGFKSTAMFHIAKMDDWLRGSFNVCVPVTIDNWNGRQQSGNRVGEKFRPGNGDEKIQCEAGAYAWLQENCPDVPIPRLYGFAMSRGESLTRIENLPFLNRWFQFLRRRLLQWLRLPVPSYYVPHQNKSNVHSEAVSETGYLLIECVEEAQGTMLSNTWTEKQQDAELRTNFFKSLSRILLSITKTPLPHIVSFIINKEGYLTLSNRPLTMELQELENEKIATEIQVSTYSTTASYVAELLGAHDSRLRNQPNAVKNLPDCGYQMAALAAMRTVAPLFFDRDFNRGPFVFSLTDLHQSNIFVDDQWHITSLVDLEWACSRPIQMVDPPYWLTNKGGDNIDVAEYDTLRKEFLTTLSVEETEQVRSLPTGDSGKISRLSEIMEQSWVKGTFWYTLALSSPSGLFNLFYNHIQPLLSKHTYEDIGGVMPFYWGRDAGKFVADKLADKKKYDSDLRQAFEASGSDETADKE
ncbi:hypothetical protein N7456_001251 [Penicillium angulare]|uniref:Aminoglycoside phosphotransferase domain-containing protein n=1 Tax=Penicillium angulare TaxID=116970 RepID=A0A9W9GF19_9EURO|nr:hypothetical protein N7456_001251 [Penicillium angulare]